MNLDLLYLWPWEKAIWSHYATNNKAKHDCTSSQKIIEGHRRQGKARPQKAIQGHTTTLGHSRQFLKYHNVPQKIPLCHHRAFLNFILTCRNIFCSLCTFLLLCISLCSLISTLFVPSNNFSSIWKLFWAWFHANNKNKTKNKNKTTKLLLGPLSVARGQKSPIILLFAKS